MEPQALIRPAPPATFSGKRENGYRPLSRLRERVGVRVRRNLP
jgi:hypothetical protein